MKKGQEHLFYTLIKALYSLRQASRAWYSKLNKSLEELGFTRCSHEHTVYMKREKGEATFVGLYVDDLLITGTNAGVINQFKQ